ncbi:metal ABC transporter permease [Candidatus Saccharibacteria bacterium]|nr:metal ABC transporter permease [Candidatus Saccharibacteria bacterium]
MNQIAEMFSYDFMLRALIVGLLISLTSALIGVSIVLRKNSMLGDGLSHVAFGAFAIAIMLGFTPIYIAIPITILASFTILHLSQKQSGDAILAIISASALAIGTLAISVGKGTNIDINGYLFGSILSVSWTDVWLSLIVAIITIILYVFLYHRIFAIAMDSEFAKSIGIKVNLYDTIFSIICSIVVVLGMRLLGALLISSLIIFPTLIAKNLAKSFKGVVITASIISCITFVIGLVLSYLLNTPTGATVVLVNLVTLIIARQVGILS